MDKQQIFTAGYLGILAQGRPSANPEEGGCYYQSPEGYKCALGFSIPDESYRNDLEGSAPECSSLSAIRSTERELFEIFGGETLEDATFLQLFQRCHDRASPYGDFLERFKISAQALAKEYNLEIPL